MAQQKDCQNCGKTFLRNTQYSEKQWQRANFCSRRCAGRKAVNASPLERLFSFVQIDPITKCWIWTGGADDAGYGFFDKERAHRYVYRVAVQEIPDGMSVLHRCDNPPCCNPFHLFLGTHQDNYDDMFLKGRNPLTQGEAVSSARLTEKEVLEIRADPRTQDEIARDYQVAQTTISAIKRSKNWKHI